MPSSTLRRTTLARRMLGAVAGLWLLGAAPAFAQPNPHDVRETAKQEGFQPVAGAPDTEKVDANKLVVAAYAAFFLGMFGYVVYVARKQSEMAGEMAELAEQIARFEDKS